MLARDFKLRFYRYHETLGITKLTPRVFFFFFGSINVWVRIQHLLMDYFRKFLILFLWKILKIV